MACKGTSGRKENFSKHGESSAVGYKDEDDNHLKAERRELDISEGNQSNFDAKFLAYADDLITTSCKSFCLPTAATSRKDYGSDLNAASTIVPTPLFQVFVLNSCLDDFSSKEKYKRSPTRALGKNRFSPQMPMTTATNSFDDSIDEEMSSHFYCSSADESSSIVSSDNYASLSSQFDTSIHDDDHNYGNDGKSINFCETLNIPDNGEQFVSRDKELKTLIETKCYPSAKRGNIYKSAYVNFLKENEAAVQREEAYLAKVNFPNQSKAKEFGKKDHTQDVKYQTEKQSPSDSMQKTKSNLRRSITLLRHFLFRTGHRKLRHTPSPHFHEIAAPENGVNDGKNYASPRPSLLLLFDLYHTLPGIFILILYCMAHVSIYDIINTIVVECTISYTNQSLVYLILMITAMIMLRLSGGIWDWSSLDEEGYTFLKFALRNKIRLGQYRSRRKKHQQDQDYSSDCADTTKESWLFSLIDWDSRVLKWFRYHGYVKMGVDILGMYLCFISATYFLGSVLIPTFVNIKDGLAENLPSLKMQEMHGSVGTDDFGRTIIRDRFQSGAGIMPTCTCTGNAGADTRMTEINNLYCTGTGGESEADVHENGDRQCASWQDWKMEFYMADDMYLWTQASVASYYAFMGDPSVSIVSTSGSIKFHSINLAMSVFILSKLGVSFWEE